MPIPEVLAIVSVSTQKHAGRASATHPCIAAGAAPAARAAAGWQYVGELARDPHCRMLECPLLTPLPELPASHVAAAAAARGCDCGRGCGRGCGEAVGAAAAAAGKQRRQHVFCYSADYCANGELG